MTPITYLREGRSIRGSGTLVATDPTTGLLKVKPSRSNWKAIWVSVREIQDAGSKAPTNHHFPALTKMVDGLRELMERKEQRNQSI